MLAYLSIIDVLTESHRSGGGVKTARHRLAPPAMLTDESWAAGERLKKNKKMLPASLCELVFMNSCCSFFFFSTFRLPVHLICVCCCCDHNAYFCVVVEIIVMIFEPPSPTPPSFRLCRLFLVESWKNVVQSHFVLHSCEFSLTFVNLWLCMCVCVRVSDCVVL